MLFRSDEDCGTCRFYRPGWKYEFCVFKECPYCPGKRTRKTDVYKRQTEDLLQLQGDEGQGVGIIALAGVQNPRNAANVAQVQLCLLYTSRCV